MFEIKVTVDIPALDRLTAKLDAYLSEKLSAPSAGPTVAPYTAPTVAPYTAPDMPVFTTPDPTPVTPVATMPAEQQAVSTTATTAPAPVVPPVTAAPAFTLAQVSKAGAKLLTSNPALIPQLQELLKKYGAATAQELPLDRLGEFAAELRALGARI